MAREIKIFTSKSEFPNRLVSAQRTFTEIKDSLFQAREDGVVSDMEVEDIAAFTAELEANGDSRAEKQNDDII